MIVIKAQEATRLLDESEVICDRLSWLLIMRRGARVLTSMSDETLTKEMKPTTDQQKFEMTKIPHRQVVDGQSIVVGRWIEC